MYSQYCLALDETQSGHPHFVLPSAVVLNRDAHQLSVHVSEHLDQIELLGAVVEVHLVAFQKVLDLRHPSRDRLYEEAVVGLLTQGVLGMQDVAQSPVDLYQLVFS